MEEPKTLKMSTYNKEKLIEYGKKYYMDRIYPTVEIEIIKGHVTLYFD